MHLYFLETSDLRRFEDMEDICAGKDRPSTLPLKPAFSAIQLALKNN